MDYDRSKKSKIDQSMSGNSSQERSTSNHDVSAALLTDKNSVVTSLTILDK